MSKADDVAGLVRELQALAARKWPDAPNQTASLFGQCATALESLTARVAELEAALLIYGHAVESGGVDDDIKSAYSHAETVLALEPSAAAIRQRAARG